MQYFLQEKQIFKRQRPTWQKTKGGEQNSLPFEQVKIAVWAKLSCGQPLFLHRGKLNFIRANAQTALQSNLVLTSAKS